MPKGPGTYGSKLGRPPKKKRLYKKGGPVAGRPAKKEKESDDVNYITCLNSDIEIFY